MAVPRATLKPPSRMTAADEAERALFQGITSGAIAPGAPLRLQDLADRLDMSMMPIREAIRRLQGLGLVEVIPHKGAWVRPLTVEDLRDTYFTRLHLEALAMSCAARRMTPEIVARAQDALAESQSAEKRGDPITARAAHERFHFELYEASGSVWLVHSIWPVWRNSERYRVESMRNRAHVAARAKEHGAMLDALAAGDEPQAVKLIVSHLSSSMELVASSLTAGEPQAIVQELPSADALIRAYASGTGPAGGPRP
jgi:DNA-binding GntR family transcriptional regulator